MRTFTGEDGVTYLVFRTPGKTCDAYHVFAEVEAKEAARQIFPGREGTTNEMWKPLWEKAFEEVDPSL